jgi:hypothetical protein
MKIGSNKERLLATTLLASLAGLGGVFGIGAAAMVTSEAAFADDYTIADLTGHVAGESGEPVAGAVVTVHSPQGGSRTARTGADGRFTVTSLAFGTYEVSIAASGYKEMAYSPVTIGGGSNAFDFTLADVQSTQAIVVTSHRAPDFNRTETGLSVSVPDLASRVPLGRTIFNVARLAPTANDTDPTVLANGVRRSQNIVNIAGASAAESAYYINGLNVTDQRDFLGYADLPFDAIQSIDVKNGGYAAEFGRATGGVVNIVTRSGTNDFHGGAAAFTTPNALRSTARDAYGRGSGGANGDLTLNTFSSASTFDSDFWLSGPIVRDHAFFFAMVNPRRADACAGVATNGLAGVAATQGTQECTHSDMPRWIGKFDVDLTASQRVEATVFSDADKLTVDDCSVFDASAGKCVGAVDTHLEKSGGINQIYRYTGVFTDWFTLSALYGQVSSQYTDESQNFGIAYVNDQRSGSSHFLTDVTNPGPFNLNSEDQRDTYRVDADFRVSAWGDHHIRLGWDDEQLHSTDLEEYTSGCYYNIRTTGVNGAPPTNPAYIGDFIRQTCSSQGGSFSATQGALYAQDFWQVTDRLALSIGVRDDIYDYKTAAGQSFIKTSDQWAPRVGFTYDPFGTGNDRFFGSYGLYYLPIAELIALREATSAPFYRDFFAIPGGGVALDENGVPALGASIAPRQVFSTSSAPDPRTVAAANIKPMYSSEFQIGWDHTFVGGPFRSWRIGAAYVDRKLQTTIEDTNLQNAAGSATSYGDGAIGRYCQRVGITAANCNTGVYEGQFTLINPGSSVVVWADPDGAGSRYITLTSADLLLPKATNHFRALELTFERPFDGRWGLQGSYVLSRSYGNYEGPVKSDTGQTDTSITQDFDDEYAELGATGYLPNDHQHTIKAFGSYSPIENFIIGANFRAQSGRHFGCIGYDPANPNPAPTPSEWFCDGELAPRGSKGVTPWTYTVDLDFAYKLPMASEGSSTTLYFDVFNVLDSQEITRVVEQGEVSSSGHPMLTYGLPRTRQDPRAVRFGIRYAF